jgi:hypothetical protein
MASAERFRSAPTGCAGTKINALLPCACGCEAAVEKCGRTVCRTCANALNGREFPLRNGRERCSFGSATEARQLDMVRQHAPQRYYGRYLG